jgi:hypothetical protein
MRTCEIRLCKDAKTLLFFGELCLIDFVFWSSCHTLNATPENRHQTHFLKGKTMKAKNILLNAIYHFMLGRNEVQGEVVEATDSGWNVRLLASDKVVKVNNADRFVRKARTIATTGDAPVEEQETPIEEHEITVEDQETVVEKQDAPVEEQETATPKKAKQPKEGMSALDAAQKVLAEIGMALTVRQITELIVDKGYCPNLKGKTPHLTISSSLQREIANKGAESRFYKGGKGLFGAVECQSE